MPRKRPYNQLADTIQHLLSDRYLFVHGDMDGDRYTFRVEKLRELDKFDDVIEFYTVHMTSRELPVAYVHRFESWSETYSFLCRFKNKEIIANEDKKTLPMLLKNIV